MPPTEADACRTCGRLVGEPHRASCPILAARIAGTPRAAGLAAVHVPNGPPLGEVEVQEGDTLAFGRLGFP